jgi:hypothetical protein
VQAREGTLTRHIQDAVHRPWAWFFEGCSVRRDLARVIAGFSSVTINRDYARSPFVPVNPQIEASLCQGLPLRSSAPGAGQGRPVLAGVKVVPARARVAGSCGAPP